MRLFHVDHNAQPKLARDIRSPMTDEMREEGKARGYASDTFLAMMHAERARLAALCYAAGGYHHVADIEGVNLEFAWTATQNGALSESWSQEPPAGVKPTEPAYHVVGGHRYGRKSSDIGDLVEADGKWFIVETFGFAEITNAVIDAMMNAKVTEALRD